MDKIELQKTGREIARTAFDLGEPVRLPVTLFAGGSWMTHRAGRTYAEMKQNPDVHTEVVLRGFQQIGHDLLWISWGSNYPIHLLGCPIKDDSSDPTTLLGTVITGLKQIESLKITKVTSSPLFQGMIRSQHMIADTIGERTMILSAQWGPFTCAAKILGVEAVMNAMHDEPQALKPLLGFCTELAWAITEPALQHRDILGMGIADPLASGDLISPDNFSEFVAPYLAELVRRARACRKYTMIHICGDTTKILEKVAEVGPHCFSLDQKVDLHRAKEVLGGKVCVAGNVSPTGVFLHGRPDDVAVEAKTCAQRWGIGGGYILTVGCDYPKTVPIENVEAFMSMKFSGNPCHGEETRRT